MKDSFVFYRSFLPAFETLSGDDCKTLLLAMARCALDGSNDPRLDGMTKTFFDMISPQLLANRERWENGKIGGRPQSKTSGFENENHRLSDVKTSGCQKRKPNVAVAVAENVAVAVAENEKKNKQKEIDEGPEEYEDDIAIAARNSERALRENRERQARNAAEWKKNHPGQRPATMADVMAVLEDAEAKDGTP